MRIRHLLAAMLTVTLLMPCTAFAQETQAARFVQPEMELPCKAAVLMEQSTGTVLYEKEADMPLPTASITKVMTLLLTMEALESGKVSLADKVPVSEHAYGMGGSQIWLEPGEEFTLDEMLRAVCVCSANDAAVAVAEFIGGSEDVFVERMNARAAELGMLNTCYKNACGLDETGHVSTARDVAVLSREVMLHHTEITDYTSIWMDSLRNGQTQLLNTNKLLRNYTGTTGLKTGTTGGAGVCITATATRDGLSLIAVILGSPSSADRFAAATALLDYGFANFTAEKTPLPSTAPAALPVRHGVEEAVTLDYRLPQTVLLKKGEEKSLLCTVELPENLEAPLEAGQAVGQVSVSAQGAIIGQYPVCVAENVAERTLGTSLGALWKSLVGME